MKRLQHLTCLFLLVSLVHHAPVAADQTDLGPTPLDQRLIRERRWSESGLYLLPHKPNYFLLWTYNSNPNSGPFQSDAQPSLKDAEAKYQLSVKVPLLRGLVRNNGDIYFGYTQLAFWQIYNAHNSSPLRETDYEPELFLQFDTDFNLGSFNNRLLTFGLDHQSNGLTDPLSRSWNRIYSLFVLQNQGWILSVRPWYRIPESSSNDDNPDIEKYLGYGDVRLVYTRHQYTFSMLLRNNLRIEGNKGAIELGYSFPLNKILRGYIQYFNGYGESLIDYNHPNNRIGVGLALSDWI